MVERFCVRGLACLVAGTSIGSNEERSEAYCKSVNLSLKLYIKPIIKNRIICFVVLSFIPGHLALSCDMSASIYRVAICCY